MTTILDDAKMVSGHAKKKAVDADDIKLAVQVIRNILLIEILFFKEALLLTWTFHEFPI